MSDKEAAPAPALLEVRDVSVRFSTARGPVEAVRNVSFDLHAGRTVAVVGESGSGKSTLCAAVNQLIAPTATIEGSVRFAGEELLGAGPDVLRRVRGAGMGLVPQDPMSNLDPVLRIGPQIVEVLEVHGTARGATARARAVELLRSVGLSEPERRFRQFPHELSGGMRQRVLVAIGLACAPRLLIADEPTSALDVTVQATVLDRMADLTAETGTAVLMVTHDLGLAAERADDVLVMYRGDLVEHGPAEQILTDPQHEYTRRLLAAAPSLTGAAPARPPVGRGGDDLVVAVDATKRYRVRDSAWSRRRDFTAVDASSFTIPRGGTVSIVGESGSGKSTTARMVLGLELPSAGSVQVAGYDVAALTPRQRFAFTRRVQPVFQNPYASLDPLFTVGATIREPLDVHGVGTPQERAARVLELAEQVALPQDLLTRRPHELSGGQRQRVAIARALSLEPELLVLDEAVSALDVLVQEQILELLTRLQAELGLTYLFISHDLAVVRRISDVVHVMQAGRIVESGTPEEIFDHPREEYTRTLLAAIPMSEGRKVRTAA